ncbi:uncharacterized protein G2W53_030308 [Senna tora]|uniref:Uncharacterized protein n=1 Tax=Senna tora TaxID=362788 RepID=A0A834T629_9FABA|nr:uncharacterized protein G2W53_030308 [Senna tora]
MDDTIRPSQKVNVNGTNPPYEKGIMIISFPSAANAI